MNQSRPSPSRVFTLDILRGVFLFTMILTHSIFFFHADSQPVLQLVRAIGDFVSFTGLLFISGAAGYIAYIHYQHPTYFVFYRIARRLFIYLIGYNLLAIWANGVINSDWSIDVIWQIVSFQRLVPFSEFIIPFIVFGFLKIPLRPLYQRMAQSWQATIIAIFSVYGLALFLKTVNLQITPLSLKAILLGHEGIYSFPLLQYAPVYLLGIFIGRLFWVHLSGKKITKLSFLMAASCFVIVTVLFMTSLAISYPFSQFFTRWPPSPAFLIAGSGFALFLLTLISRFHDLKNFPWTRTALIILGQNTFPLLFSHTFIIYTYKWLNLPQVHSILLFVSFWAISLFLAIYLAKILPLNYRFGLTFINWCECRLWHCSHAQEYRLILAIKKLFWQLTKLSDIFALRIGHKKFSLLRGKATFLALTLVLLTATPLGIAENELIFQHAIASVSGALNRHWLLTTESDKSLNYTVSLPVNLLTGQKNIEVFYQIDDQEKRNMELKEGNWLAQISVADLPVGKHQITAIVDINYFHYRSQSTTFNISAPVFITWTIDWEGYDVDNEYLTALTNIAQEHGISMTHLFNPRIFTNKEMKPERVWYLVEWVKDRRDFKNEEIGMHLHLFPDLVEAAAVEPKREPAWGGGFTPGYDILTTAYSYEEMKKILLYAKELFNQHHLGDPRSYRAGGWFANLTTLRALQDTGFLIDSSGRTKYVFGTKKLPGFWDLPVTIKPYYPSIYNQNSSDPAAQLTILEIANNGGDSFAFSAAEMIDRFKQNYDGGVISHPIQVTYLSHPHWFNQSRQQAMRQVFSHINQWSSSDDKGPVVYTTLLGVYQTFKNFLPAPNSGE